MGGVQNRKRKIGRFRYKAKRSYKKTKEIHAGGKINEIRKDVQQELWDKKKSAEANCSNLGILYNLTKAMKPKTLKDEAEEEEKDFKKKRKENLKTETNFVKNLSTKCKENEKKKNAFSLRLPERTVEYLTYLLDTYGENYKAMAQDGRNYDQDTWKQLRAKINKFKRCSDQYAQYLKKRDLLT